MHIRAATFNILNFNKKTDFNKSKSVLKHLLLNYYKCITSP